MLQKIDGALSGRKRRALAAALAAAVGMAMLPAAAQDDHHHQQNPVAPPPPFIASTAKPFAALMADAMAVMQDGMQHAPMTGVVEHDFIAMMIPHHQGAIDMAKAVLLTSDDMELKNLAQGIITEQENEIRVMQAWLQRHDMPRSSDSNPSR